ncbi:MAG TPA: hypothetical protein VGQ57_06915, partial [Polyangiaceae bacterium]|nr:hypothetical protein [Polyangiaceae bacterium]
MSDPPAPHHVTGIRPAPWGWLALGAAVAVFVAFFGYALVAPRTYLATAQILLKPNGDPPFQLPAPPPPAERLRRAALDPETLQAVAVALDLGSGPGALNEAKLRLDQGFEVKEASPNTFDVSARAPTAELATQVCNLLARHAASHATLAFGPPPVDEKAAREAARTKSAAELATFMAAHPELTAKPVVTPVGPNGADADPAALRAEKDQLQSKINQLTDNHSSDNPFGDVTAANAVADRLRRRIAEIDQTLLARKRAEKKADAQSKVSPDVDRE